MNDPKRIDFIIDLLRERWKKSPDLRLGQLVWSLAKQYNEDSDAFYVEDDSILAALLIVSSPLTAKDIRRGRELARELGLETGEGGDEN